MRKSADRQRKRQSRAAAPKHPADPPRDLGSEPPRWSSSSRAPVLLRSTACSGSTLDRPYSYCNDGATSTDLLTDLVCGTACCGSKQIPSSRLPTIRVLAALDGETSTPRPGTAPSRQDRTKTLAVWNCDIS